MRFLLHPTTQRASSQGLRKGGKSSKKGDAKKLPGSSVVVSTEVVGGPVAKTDITQVRTWGQQCSPTCGCVVRFEATVDPTTNKFTSASYHAKSVVVTRNSKKNGVLEPALTLRTNRPMFRSCRCKSLHKLASRVAEYLPNKGALAFGSNMEFAGVRASPAFRHTVLEKQGLGSANTHCFDVVEEALTAMVKGHMPKPREQVTMKEIYAKRESASSARNSAKYGHEHGQAIEGDDYDDDLQIDMSSILAAPRAMSALKLLDVKADYSPFSFDKDSSGKEPIYKKKDEVQPSSKNLDWVTYVDELYEKNNQASA